MATSSQQVLQELEQLVIKGDYAAAKKFILEHFKELPEKMQQQVLAELLADQLEAAAGVKTQQLEQTKQAAGETIGMVKEELKQEIQSGGGVPV